jgi:hypothetical protein
LVLFRADRNHLDMALRFRCAEYVFEGFSEVAKTPMHMNSMVPLFAWSGTFYPLVPRTAVISLAIGKLRFVAFDALRGTVSFRLVSL